MKWNWRRINSVIVGNTALLLNNDEVSKMYKFHMFETF